MGAHTRDESIVIIAPLLFLPLFDLFCFSAQSTNKATGPHSTATSFISAMNCDVKLSFGELLIFQ
jgi:hypothetical protein